MLEALKISHLKQQGSLNSVRKWIINKVSILTLHLMVLDQIVDNMGTPNLYG